MGYKYFSYALGFDSLERNGKYKLRETVLRNEKVFIILRGCHEFPQNVDSNKLQWSRSKNNLFRLILSANIDAIFGTGDSVTTCGLRIEVHVPPIKIAA